MSFDEWLEPLWTELTGDGDSGNRECISDMRSGDRAELVDFVASCAPDGERFYPTIPGIYRSGLCLTCAADSKTVESLCDSIIAWPEVASGLDGDDKFANYAVGLVNEVAKVTGKDRLSKIQVVRGVDARLHRDVVPFLRA